MPLPERASGPAGAPASRFADGSVDTVHELLKIIDIVPVGVAHVDREGRLRLVNATLCEVLGYRPQELVGKEFAAIVAASDRAACNALNTGVATGILPEYRRYTVFTRRDGSSVGRGLRVVPVRALDGAVSRLVAVVEAVTADLVTAGSAVEDRLSAALDASRTGTFRWEISAADPEWDANLDRLFGLDAEPRTHSLDRLLTMIHPDDVARVVEAMWVSIGDGGVFEADFRVVWPDGSVHWLHERGRTVADDRGAPLYLTGACTDVTDRVLAERTVQESEAKLRRIVDSGMVGVYYWTVDGDIIDANDAFLRMLGYARDDLRDGIDVRRITPPAWAAVDAAKRRQVVETGVATPWEKEFVSSDGETVPVLVAEALLDGPDGQGIAICLDVSERKEVEIERERLLSLEHDARAQAERAIRQRDEVLAIVAHDLRNPVSTILMSASTLLAVSLDDDQRSRHLNIIQRAATSMENLIRDLLDVSRIEAGTFAVRRETVDVRALLYDTLELFEEQARPRGIRLVSDIADEISTIAGDPDRLAQALANLLSNAIKFSPPGGAVQVDARLADGAIQVSVTDNGPGISADDLPHIFDRYWQADRASRAGAGLGLLIARGIVESHGGRIDVESAVGTGTTFRCTLPTGAA